MGAHFVFQDPTGPTRPQDDLTSSYQSMFKPAVDPDNDQASVFSLRLRTVF